MIIIILKKKKKRMGKKYSPNNLPNEGFKFIYPKKKKDGEKSKPRPEKSYCWKSKIKETKNSDDKDLTDTSSLEGDDSDEFIDTPDMQPLEGDEEEVKERKGLEILTPNKFLTRFSILSQINAGNNS